MICAACYQHKTKGKMFENQFYCKSCLVKEKARRIKAGVDKFSLKGIGGR